MYLGSGRAQDRAPLVATRGTKKWSKQWLDYQWVSCDDNRVRTTSPVIIYDYYTNLLLQYSILIHKARTSQGTTIIILSLYWRSCVNSTLPWTGFSSPIDLCISMAATLVSKQFCLHFTCCFVEEWQHSRAKLYPEVDSTSELYSFRSILVWKQNGCPWLTYLFG